MSLFFNSYEFIKNNKENLHLLGFGLIVASVTHLKNIVGVLKRNNVIVKWNDSLWWQTEMVEFIAIMQRLNDNKIIDLQLSSKSVCTDAFSTQKLKENPGYIIVSYF